MNTKTIATAALLAFVAVSVGYLIVSEATTDRPKTAAADEAAPAHASTAPTAAPPPAPAQDKVIAYYFHNTKRCATCLKIEQLAEEALRERFADAFESGRLQWRELNMEKPANARFVEEYQLVASSVVLVDVENGERRNWEKMDKIWELVGDEAAFKHYIADQAQAYLE